MGAAGHKIHYSAPIVHIQDELSDAHDDGGVVDPSHPLFFRPGVIRLLRNDEQRCIMFTPVLRVAYFQSKDSEPIKPLVFSLQPNDEPAVVLERRSLL